MKQRFEAHDGKLFDSEIECRLYEKLRDAKAGDELPKLVRSLFDGCVTTTRDEYEYEVFYMSDLSKLSYNLVRKIPQLAAAYEAMRAQVEKEMK